MGVLTQPIPDPNAPNADIIPPNDNMSGPSYSLNEPVSVEPSLGRGSKRLKIPLHGGMKILLHREVGKLAISSKKKGAKQSNSDNVAIVA